VGTPSGGEFLLVLLVILLLFGSKNLPHMARTLGRTMETFRRAAREVTDEIVQSDVPAPPAAKPLIGPVAQSADGVPTDEAKADDDTKPETTA
jgi:sec-independent protein translocase protein TatA